MLLRKALVDLTDKNAERVSDFIYTQDGSNYASIDEIKQSGNERLSKVECHSTVDIFRMGTLH